MNYQQLPSGVSITPLPAFTDNYIWCFHNNQDCVVVDPGDAGVVIKFCQDNDLKLSAVLITHHHADHTGGLPKLTEYYPEANVYGPHNPKIALINRRVAEGDRVDIDALGLTFEIIDIPGHTLDHIGFVGHGGVLCGDTLFSAGCGRLFEGTPSQMLASLTKLSQLPDTTKVWCTHEYTLANLQFALAVEPDNQALQQYAKWAKTIREKDQPTLPSDMKTQKAINPFLRAHSQTIMESAQNYGNQTLVDELAVFTAVRRWKDNF